MPSIFTLELGHNFKLPDVLAYSHLWFASLEKHFIRPRALPFKHNLKLYLILIIQWQAN